MDLKVKNAFGISRETLKMKVKHSESITSKLIKGKKNLYNKNNQLKRQKNGKGNSTMGQIRSTKDVRFKPAYNQLH